MCVLPQQAGDIQGEKAPGQDRETELDGGCTVDILLADFEQQWKDWRAGAAPEPGIPDGLVGDA